LRAGLAHGSVSHPQDGAATSQPQLGAGAGSQQAAGAASQHADFLKRPAEAVVEKLTAMAAIAREAIKRMDFSPNINRSFLERVLNFLA
jgi:hypothetical protein